MRFLVIPQSEKMLNKIFNFIFAFVLIGIVSIISSSTAFAFEHPGGLHTKQLLETVRHKVVENEEPWASAYEALIAQADENLQRTPDPIEDFNVPGYYDDPDGHRAAMDRLSLDGWAAYGCAIAYQTSSGENRIQYAEKALEVLNAWASTNKKASNFDGDLAMTDAGVGLVLAAELMSDYDGWEVTQQDTFKLWLNLVYLKSCDKIVNEINNWGDWAILGRITSHYFLDDETAIDSDIELIKDKINKEIAADGHMPLETSRERRGMWYTYFALAPITAACQVGEHARDIDLFRFKGKDGAGVEEALDYFFKYCLNPEDWPHYSGSDLNKAKPTRWPGNLYDAMSTIYSKREYADWVVNARPCMEYGHHYAWAAPTLLQDESFIVTGRVVQRDGEEVIAKMKIELYNDEWQLLSDQMTDENGNFKFGCVRTGMYYIAATGFVEHEGQLINRFLQQYSGEAANRDNAALISITENAADVNFVMQAVTGIKSYDDTQHPSTLVLKQNYPNPFNPITNMTIELPRKANVSVRITNMRGELIRNIVRDRVLNAGSYEFVWDGTTNNGAPAPSGVYSCNVFAENSAASRKMILLR